MKNSIIKISYACLFLFSQITGLKQVNAQDEVDCDLYANYILISENGFRLTSRLDKGLPEFVQNQEIFAVLNTININKKLGYDIQLCYRGFSVATIEQLSAVESLSINKEWWEERKKKYGDKKLPKAIRGPVRRKMKEICARAQLFIGDVSTWLPAVIESDKNPPLPIIDNPGAAYKLQSQNVEKALQNAGIKKLETPPVSSEKVVNIIIMNCEFELATDNAKKLKGLIKSGDVLGTLLSAAQNLTEFNGRAIEGDIHPDRKNEKPFLRNRKVAIHTKGLTSAKDATLLHEMAHYLGLSHLGSQGVGLLGIGCDDKDKNESGVKDTPPGVGSLSDEYKNGKSYGDFWNQPRDEWPVSCDSVTLLNGESDSRVPIRNALNWGVKGEEQWEEIELSDGQLEIMNRMSGLLK